MKVRDLFDFFGSLFLILVIFSPVTTAAAVSQAPLGTTLAVMFLTTFAFGSVVTTILAYLGVALFGVSFPIGEHYGLLPALVVWATGIGIWMTGVCYGYKGGLRVPKHISLT